MTHRQSTAASTINNNNNNNLNQRCQSAPPVQLTKVKYFETAAAVAVGANAATTGSISTISGGGGVTTSDNTYDGHRTIIKNNIFGHRWVLRINDTEVPKRCRKIKVLLYVFVFCCIVVAVCFGIYFSLEPYLRRFASGTKTTTTNVTLTKNDTNTHERQVGTSKPTTILTTTKKIQISSNKTQTTPHPHHSICGNCTPPHHICLKTQETEKPECLKAADKKDPTGCGGLCLINIQFCQLLDIESRVYQCSPIKNALHCPLDSFNCGNMCISKTNRCDGMVHCSNQSDEEGCECDLKTHFQCGNRTSCLEISRQCDGKIDCWDKSDEKNCTKVSDCRKDQISCTDGQCIPVDNFCDGVFQCGDKSDEPKGC